MLVLLEKTFAIVILSVAIAKSKNLQSCLWSKTKYYLIKSDQTQNDNNPKMTNSTNIVSI